MFILLYNTKCILRDDIEKRLRSLRRKIENAKKEDLDNLTTADGAAGFRRQLFNCISCDKPLHLRTGEPVLNLPQPSAFPARLSLRPNMTYDMDTGTLFQYLLISLILYIARHMSKLDRGELDTNLIRSNSNMSSYSHLLMEKEIERRRKLKENKQRQETNPYK